MKVIFRICILGSINCEGLGEINWDELFSVPKEYWKENIQEEINFLENQVTTDLPAKIREQLDAQKERIFNM